MSRIYRTDKDEADARAELCLAIFSRNTKTIEYENTQQIKKEIAIEFMEAMKGAVEKKQREVRKE